jgi:hypothetical protein
LLPESKYFEDADTLNRFIVEKMGKPLGPAKITTSNIKKGMRNSLVVLLIDNACYHLPLMTRDGFVRIWSMFSQWFQLVHPVAWMAFKTLFPDLTLETTDKAKDWGLPIIFEDFFKNPAKTPNQQCID